ncbi:MAG: NFACT family protein [Clostridia bacterium]|nr:NFACT family protein [Clostridia bacterium]
MPQDAFHIRRLSKELDKTLKGCRINKINQADKDELTFHIYTGFSTVKLVLSTNASYARVCLTQTEKEPAVKAPNFCMLLRKHLQGAEILSVAQRENERIIEIELLCHSDFSSAKRVLIAELMGKYSNLVLTENGVVLGALKSTSLDAGARRLLFSGVPYAYPDPQDKLSPFDRKGIAQKEEEYFLFNERNADTEAEFIFNFIAGIALPTAREMAKRKEKQTLPLSEFIGEFFEKAENEPCTVYQKGVPTDFFAFPVADGKPQPSLMKAEDEYYTYKETAKLFTEKKQRLQSVAKNLKKKREKTLALTMERLQSAQTADEDKLKGELITANLYKIRKGDETLVAQNWYSENAEEIKIRLDPTLSPSQNAQKYFKAYNKAKRTKEALIPRLQKEEAEKNYADSILFSLLKSETDTDLKEIEEELVSLGLCHAAPLKAGVKKKPLETPFREYSYQGFLIRSGRNNLQNERLLKQTDGEDLWLHTQKYHSSFVTVKSDGKTIPDEVIRVAAEICAYYSEGKDGEKIPVDYCKRKKVKKPSGGKTGFVTYTDYKTALATPHPHKDLSL